MFRIMSFAAVAAFTAAAAQAAPVALSLGGNGRTLVRIADLANPGAPATMTGAPIRDASGASVAISDIDYRPATGELFGYGNDADTVYRIDIATGLATPVASLPGATGVETLGVDFNNSIDAARIITTNGENYVFFPNGGPGGDGSPEIRRFTDLGYAAGDPNAGVMPEVFANAYLDAIPGGGTQGAMQFALDAQTDALVTLANNTGVLGTVGSLFRNGMAVDVTANGGFDILSMADGAGGASDTAFALLTTFEGIGLYELSLTADGAGRVEATLLGALGGQFGALRGLTVFDDGAGVAPVPVPGAMLLLCSGLLGLGALRRPRAAG